MVARSARSAIGVAIGSGGRQGAQGGGCTAGGEPSLAVCYPKEGGGGTAEGGVVIVYEPLKAVFRP